MPADAAGTVGRAAAAAMGVTATPVRVEVMPLGDLPFLLPAELVGYAEAATLLGVSRQRVRELDGMAEKEGRPIARHADFPAAVTRPPTGALFDRAEIVAFGAAWERRVGRPPKGERPST